MFVIKGEIVYAWFTPHLRMNICTSFWGLVE